MAENEREWIVEPPAPGEIALHFAVGEGVQLTKEQEAAVSALLATLEAGDAEVMGHAKCPKQGQCTQLSCKPVVGCDLKCGTLKAITGGGGGWNVMGSFGGLK